MNSFSCMFQSGKSRKELFHHEKGPERKTRNKAQTRAELAAQVDEAMKKHPDPYEVTREKPGYTKITGPTLILGDEASSGLRMGIDRNEEGKVDLGAGRIWSSHRKEIAAEGQTAAGFKEKIKKNLGFRIKTYSNAILQIGKHDLLGGKSAKEVFKEIKEIWTLCDQHKMKVYACTIPPFGGNKEQEAERVKLNQLILDSPEADQLVFGVIDLEHKMNNLNTNVKDVYVEGKHRKAVAETDKDKMTVAYLEALMGGGRDSLKVAEQSPMFSHPPQKTSYVMLGDSYAEGNESYLGGKKSPGQYIKTPTLNPETEKAIPRVPGENTSKMFDRLETEVIPMLTKVAGYRCAVIRRGPKISCDLYNQTVT